MRTGDNKGFTLVEMSIVLIIIGLVTGAILVGHTLIEQARIRALMIDIGSYRTAVFTFRDRYNALPGDLADATAYWGAQNDCSATGAGTIGAGTCNGDGNKHIDYQSQAVYSGTQPTSTREEYLVWQHLAYAKLINGSYTGSVQLLPDGTQSNGYTRYGDNATLRLFYVDRNQVSWSGKYPIYMPQRHYFEFSGPHSERGVTEPIVTPETALSIDSKFDDGLPNSGNITAPPQGIAATAAADCTNVPWYGTVGGIPTVNSYNITHVLYDNSYNESGLAGVWCALYISAGF